MRHCFDTPLGPMLLEETDGALTRADFAPDADCGGKAPTPLLAQAQQQLTEYFSGQRTAFALPLRPEGTAFQKQVWAAMARIPYGQTATYGQLAAALGKPGASRAVGGACHNNPLGILLPCHRVVGTGGKLTGYAGGLERKEFLLQLEQRHKTA